MDPRRFDSLTRSLAAPKSRRGFLGALAALGAGLGVRRAAEAQVTQAFCGNVICASNPGVCKPGCVCCVYGNGNSRCRPPDQCTGTVATTTTTAAPTTTTTTVAPTTTTTTTTTTTAAPICTITNTTCTDGSDICSGGNCYCRPSTEGTTFCGIEVALCSSNGYCNSSAGCDANERCALNTCCGRTPGSDCCPLTGGVCIPICGESTSLLLAPAALGPNSSPPGPGK